jgi:replicative DNA helicase
MNFYPLCSPRDDSEDKSLPHCEDGEKGLLCSMFLHTDLLIEYYHHLSEQVFYIPAHQHIFTTLRSLKNNNHPIDFISVKKALSDSNLLEEVGGAQYLNELYTFVPTAANANYYVEIVKDYYQRRVAILEAKKLIQAMYDPNFSYEGAIGECIERTLTKLALGVPRQERSFSDQVIDTIEMIDQRTTEGKISGARFGIPSLDEAVSGVQPGDLCIIAAETSGGKTALALAAVKHMASVMQKPVAWFSLEMPATQMIERFLANESRISMRSLRGGFLSEGQLKLMLSAVERIAKYPIFLDDSSYADISKIVSECRRLRAKHDIALVVVDYLQLIESPSVRKEGNREREVAHISRQLKNMAKELMVPVIALSQLNDQGLLRESRAIGQDADIVLKIHWVDVNTHDRREIEIVKQRNGPRGERILLQFHGEYMLFSVCELVRFDPEKYASTTEANNA